MRRGRWHQRGGAVLMITEWITLFCMWIGAAPGMQVIGQEFYVTPAATQAGMQA